MDTINSPRPPILFVDDDPVAHELIKSYLKDWEIRSAYSGKDALEILGEESIKIVISDINMPGMDGLDLLREIKRTRGIVQVIIATATEQVQDLLGALEAGANDFLLKPFRKDDVEEALEHTLLKLERWKGKMKDLFKKKKEIQNTG